MELSWGPAKSLPLRTLPDGPRAQLALAVARAVSVCPRLCRTLRVEQRQTGEVRYHALHPKYL